MRVAGGCASMYEGVPGACSGVPARWDGGAAAGSAGSGWTGVVVVVPVIAEASLRIAMTAPVPTSTMAANTPAVTSSGRYHASAVGLAAVGSLLRCEAELRAGRAQTGGRIGIGCQQADLGHIVDFRPGQCMQRARLDRRGDDRKALILWPSDSSQGGAAGGGQFRVCGGDHRNPKLFGQCRGDRGDVGTAADGGDRRQIGGMDAVAEQVFSQYLDERRQWPDGSRRRALRG